MKKLNFDIEYLEWFDATSVDEWTDVYEIMEKPAHTIKTCGYVINEDADTITMALNYDPEGEVVSCVMYIPKGLITKRMRMSFGESLSTTSTKKPKVTQ